jgi:hypothetical protein
LAELVAGVEAAAAALEGDIDGKADGAAEGRGEGGIVGWTCEQNSLVAFKITYAYGTHPMLSVRRSKLLTLYLE